MAPNIPLLALMKSERKQARNANLLLADSLMDYVPVDRIWGDQARLFRTDRDNYNK
jgi:hypothetical protein